MNSATGVRTPVRPTCTTMSVTTVVASSGGNLYAMAHRGELRRLPEAFLVGERVHLHDDAVRLERKVVALRPPCVEKGEDPLHTPDDGAMRVDGKGDFFESRKASALGRRLAIALPASH